MSSFAGIGKKTAWAAWNVYPEVTEAFAELMHMADPMPRSPRVTFKMGLDLKMTLVAYRITVQNVVLLP